MGEGRGAAEPTCPRVPGTQVTGLSLGQCTPLQWDGAAHSLPAHTEWADGTWPPTHTQAPSPRACLYTPAPIHRAPTSRNCLHTHVHAHTHITQGLQPLETIYTHTSAHAHARTVHRDPSPRDCLCPFTHNPVYGALTPRNHLHRHAHTHTDPRAQGSSTQRPIQIQYIGLQAP